MARAVAVGGGHARPSVVAPLLAIVLGLLGIALPVWSAAGILDSNAYNNGNGDGTYLAMMVVGGILTLGTVVVSIIGVSRRGRRLLWAFALMVGSLPLIAILVALVIVWTR